MSLPKSALRVDENITDTKEMVHTGWGWALKCRYHQQQLHWWFPSPSLLLPTAAAGLSSLAWNLTEIPFLSVRGGSGAPSAEPSAQAPGNVSPGMYQGHLARPRAHPPGESSQIWLPPLCAPILPPCPLLLHWLFSGVKMTQEPSPIMAHLVPKGQLCVVSVLFLSILSPFRLLCLWPSRGFFSHKYSLSALDASFCHQTHTFCPFSQQSHDLQVTGSTKIGEVLSLSSASTQFPALLMLCAQGQVKRSPTEKIILSLW